MPRDIGSYFEKLTRKGQGGRRLDVDDSSSIDRDDDEHASPPRARGPKSQSGLQDILGDLFGRGRATATTTAKKTADKARTTARRRSSERAKRSRKKKLPAEGVVTIEYSPRIDGDPDPGEVVWTWVPFEEDPEQGKDRPVVVIGRRGGKLVGVPLTTKRSDREAQIAIGTGAWDPKRRTSYARIWRMLDLEDGRMRREGAVLDQRRFDKVTAAVDEYYDVHRPPAAGNGDDWDY